MRASILLVLGISLFGCDAQEPELGEVAVTVDRDTYVIDSTIHVKVSNVGQGPVQLLERCGDRLVVEVKRSTETGWETEGVLNQLCQAVYDQSPVELESGGEWTVSFSPQRAGRYEVSAKWGLGNPSIYYVSTSPPFTVEGL